MSAARTAFRWWTDPPWGPRVISAECAPQDVPPCDLLSLPVDSSLWLCPDSTLWETRVIFGFSLYLPFLLERLYWEPR